MYETIMLDGEEIRVKIDVDEKQTGKIILPELNNTEDLSEVVNYINENIDEEETNE